MTIQERLHTIEEFERFLQQPENKDRRLELIHGTVVEKAMPTEEHGLIVANIVFFLKLFLQEKLIGRVVVETAYRHPADALNRRIPDVSFTSNEHNLPLTKKGTVPQLPDLAVEVKSPDDTYAEMREKANYYLSNGSRLVWLVYPETQRVEVHAKEQHVTTLEADDTLTGGDVLSDFEVKLKKIFA